MIIELWLLYTVAADIFWTLNNFLDKIVISRYNIPVFLFVALANLTSLAPLLVSLLFVDFSTLTPFDLGLSLLNGLVLGLAGFMYALALTKLDTTTVVTILQSTPVFVLVAETILYDRIFEPVQYLGIVLVLTGTLIVVRNPDSRTQDRLLHLQPPPGVMYALLFSLAWAVSVVLQEDLTLRQSTANVFCMAKVGEVLLGLAYFSVPKWRRSISLVDTHTLKKATAAILAGEALNGIALAALMMAIAIGSMSLVTTVGAAQPVFSLLMILGINALIKEAIPDEGSHKYIKMKLAGMALVFLGIYCVS